MAIKVKLTYFKRGGKYYTEWEGDLDLGDETPIHQVWDNIQSCRRDDMPAPGLCSSSRDYMVLVECPGHPHDHPVILMPIT